MEPSHTNLLQRTSSQTSATSSRRSSRVRPRKQHSTTSLGPVKTSSPSDKSLTSFPSLSPSPETSPQALRSFVPTPVTQAAPSFPTSPGPTPPTAIKTSRATPSSIVGGLTAVSPSEDGRDALFADSPSDAQSLPGILNRASDEHIERELARTGPVALVRQLAEDLALRDAQVTGVRRQAEERERLLKKMLKECNISSQDIDRRLKALEKAKVDRMAGLNHSRNVSGADSASGDRMPTGGSLRVRLSEALRDLKDDNEDSSDPFNPSTGGVEDLEATIRASKSGGPIPIQDETSSLASVDSNTGLPRKAKEGWKSYLFGHGTSKRSSIHSQDARDDIVHGRPRASSSALQKRKGLNEELFNPPSDMQRSFSGTSLDVDNVDSEVRSNKSSTSVSSWAVKLVGGNRRRSRDSESLNNTREQSSRQQGGYDTGTVRAASDASRAADNGPRSTQSGPAGVESAKLRNNLRQILDNSAPPNTKKSRVEKVRAAAGAQSAGGHQESLPRQLSNLGPVEMDMILPEDSQPPALSQTYSWLRNGQIPTDKFGFIYDQQRKNRQSEAATAIENASQEPVVESLSSARDVINTADFPDDEDARVGSPSPEDNSSTTTRWQDFLSLATFPTELLSHTPIPAPISTVLSSDLDTATTPARESTTSQRTTRSASLSSDPSASPSTSTQGSAQALTGTTVERASPFQRQPDKPVDPFKVYLDHLTELHGSLQKSRTIRWNEFLRKVRAERKREGKTAAAADGKAASAPEVTLADGEIIGMAGLGVKGKVGRAKWNEFRGLVVAGIPVAYRAKIWAECSGAASLRVPGYYDDLVHDSATATDETTVTQIKMDITRTLTDNVFFRTGPGVARLEEVLTAYALRNPEVGYCQGMNLIAGSLLLTLPTAEDAFWVLASMIESILPGNYYDNSLLTSRADQQVLRSYVTELLPRLSSHLDKLSVELEALTFQWFLSIFTDCLSAEALYRVWDVFLCLQDGSTFMFQVALALLKLNERQLTTQCESPAEVYHYINHQMTNHAISIDGLIQASDALRNVIRRADIEQRRDVAVAREREVMRQREELRRRRSSLASSSATGRRRREEGAQNSRNDDNRGQDEVTPQSPPPAVLSTPIRANSKSSLTSTPLQQQRTLRRSRSNVADATDEYYDESPVAVSPMPMDEEALWRA